MNCGIIKVGVASLYAEADKNSILVDEALHGTDVTIIEELENFYKIKTFYSYEGYVQKEHLEVREDNIKNWNMKNKMTVIKPYVDVKQSFNSQSYAIGNLTRGAIVSVSEDEINDNYRKIYLTDGTEGYIREAFLTKYIKPSMILSISNEEIVRENIVKNAVSYLGAQYRWGGKTPLGIDCSGLCFMSYLLEGIIIFRDAEIKDGFPVKKIDIGIIKQGDLIFFTGHVAIYMGKGEFVHSSHKNNGVCINSLYHQSENYDKELHNSMVSIGSIF